MFESSLPQSDPMPLTDRPFARLARSVAGYGLATALMLVSPLLVFAPAALFHCAMRNGRRAAWTAAVIASGLSTLYFAQVANASGASDVRMAWTSLMAILLSVVAPALVVLPLVERAESFGRTLMIALVSSAVGLGITEVAMRVAAAFSPLAVHTAQAHQTAAKIVEMYRSANAGADVLQWMQRWMHYAVDVLPAMILIDIALVFVLSLMMLGRLTVWRPASAITPVETEMRQKYLFRNLSLPDWVLFLFVFGGTMPLLKGTLQNIAANVLALVVFLYLLQGLAIFRSMLVRAGAGFIGGIFGFVLLIMLAMAGIGLLLLAVAGLFDSFFDFRHLKGKDDSHESHTD